MSSTKGKGKEISLPGDTSDHGSSSDSSSSSSESEPSFEESDPDTITQEYLESLLAKAKAEAANKRREKNSDVVRLGDEDVILLDGDQKERSLPALDPGPSFPRPYFKLGSSRTEVSSLILDVDAEGIQRSAPSQPSAVPAPPELNNNGKRLTKRQRKEQIKGTAGPDWFDLPAPAAADLPKLHREVEALRLRNSLDPKRFYRKESGEGKGIKGLPKHFAIGTIIPSSTPFGTPSAENLTKAQRKRTVVDELVDDAEARRYAKRKFLDLQGVRGERGRGTWARKTAGRRGKW